MTVLEQAEKLERERVPCVPGAPSWVSLLTPDLDAAQAFYGPLLGWEFEAAPGHPRPYVHAAVRGVRTAGIGALPEGWPSAAVWTTFFGVGDIDVAARRVRERAGTVGLGPVDFPSGRVAIATDPDGAVFGLWQGRPGPARRMQHAGAPVWIELSSDAFAAALFYGTVLDWAALDPAELDVSWEHERVVLRVQGRKVAAMRTADAYPPVPIRPHWHISFAVPDLDRAVERALNLGAEPVGPATEGPYGTAAGLCDPQGAVFSLISPA
ncbi:VOC family protein [Streptacidiphilus sp. MAP12-16]|uniref:VOC family protein n=1 Tax=Streptacidiphilus sp. MAP12-16 TaxID=3156300 RepID=UPI0035187430